MKKTWLVWSLCGLSPLLAACGGSESLEGTVAQAGEHRLTVDEVVALLADQEQFPPQAEVVRALANLWIDYTLLAEAVARDSTLSQLDFEPLIRPQMEQVMIRLLRDSVIQVDTAISEGELRTLYESQAPEARVRARHILLTYPEGATQAQRDSVRARLQELRQRIVAGEPFEAVARQHSQDASTAALGGDLGFFGRGETVRPIEEAVFQLDPGEVSAPVESPYGLHLVKVEERQLQGFEEVAGAFRRNVQQQRNTSAESTYVAGLVDAAAGEVAEGAAAVVREIARDPAARFSGRSLRRPLLSYSGGAITVGEMRAYLRMQSPQYRQQVQNAADAQLENLLRSLLNRELLIEQARTSGLGPSEPRVDSAVAQAREELTGLADELGLVELDLAPGEPRERGVERAVTGALENILVGATDVVPLGPIAFQLRERSATGVYDSGIGASVLRIAEIRATRGRSPLESSRDSALAAPDTSGR